MLHIAGHPHWQVTRWFFVPQTYWGELVFLEPEMKRLAAAPSSRPPYLSLQLCQSRIADRSLSTLWREEIRVEMQTVCLGPGARSV